ncbi:MAG: hypothetical protein ACFFBH_09615 [Promethearchaeota archaeon]
MFSTPQGRDPKDPKESNSLELCHKDFKNFKERNGDKIIELLSTLITNREIKRDRPEPFKQQKVNLIKVKSLIHEGKEREAFETFYRAFPYCMPYRPR